MTDPPSQEAASSEEGVKHLIWWDSPELLLSPPVLIVFVTGIDGAIGSLSLNFPPSPPPQSISPGGNQVIKRKEMLKQYVAIDHRIFPPL